MFFSDKITLRAVTNKVDADGYKTQTTVDTQVWANVKSVSRSEFYAANANKLEVTQAFDVHVEDWNNQTQVIYEGKLYYIVRAYQKGLGIVELNCSNKKVV